jgi:diguanylate cyclase (GGDEF)-like protein
MAVLKPPLLLLQALLRFPSEFVGEKYLVQETGLSLRVVRKILNRLNLNYLLVTEHREGETYYRLKLEGISPSLLKLIREFIVEEENIIQNYEKIEIKQKILKQQLEEKEKEEYKASARTETFVNSLVFLEEISSIILRSQTFAQVFKETFKRLFSAVNYDIGITAILEDKLNIYIIHKSSIPREIIEKSIIFTKEKMGITLSLPYLLQDYNIIEEIEEIEIAPAGKIQHSIGTTFQKDPMTPGYISLFRIEDTPFLADEKQVLDVLSTQMALACQNITALQKIQQLAITDDLTGIYNKRYFKQAFAKEFERAQRYNIPLSLMMMDLDFFKRINDKYGHQLGDVVLSEFAALVLEMTRSTDIFARYGGEEFSLILPHTPLNSSIEIAERIRNRVETYAFPGEEFTIHCTVSIGLAQMKEEYRTPEELISTADMNLYKAKTMGRNMVIFS